MSELIPSIDFEDLVKIVRAGRVAELQACEVLIDGEHCFTAIIFHGDMFSSGYARTRAEYLGVKANITGGKTPAEVLSSLVPIDPYPNLTKAREARKAKRELVKV